MAEPTLNDLTSIRGDAAIAGGSAGAGAATSTPAPVQFDQGLQFLNEASQARAGYNKYLEEQYQKNLSDSLSNLRSIDFSKAMASDLPDLRQKYADLAKNVADNIQAVQNPASNPQIASQLTEQEADLRGAIAQSTNHNIINTYNKNFLAANPTFNTKENQDKVSQFETTPIGQRKDFLLSTPNNFDLNKIAQAAAPYALQTIQKESLSHDKNWLETTEGQQFSQDAYHKAAVALKNNTIVNGESLNDSWVKDYNLLPADLKNGLSADDAFLAGIDALAPQTSMKNTFVANPYGLNRQTEGFQASEAAKTRKFESDQNDKNRSLQVKLLKKGEIDPTEAGESKLRTLASAFTSGNLSDDLGQKVYGDNNKISKPVKVMNTNAAGILVPEVSKIPVPMIQYKGSSIDAQGNLHIHRIDNATNQPLPDVIRSYDQAYSDFDKLYGDAYAPQIGSATATYSQKNFKKPTPTLQELRTHFNVPNVVTNKFENALPASGTPVIVPDILTHPNIPAANTGGGMSDDAYKDLLKRNGLK